MSACARANETWKWSFHRFWECSKYILVSLLEVRCQVFGWNVFRLRQSERFRFKNELRKCSNSWKEFLFAASNSNLQLLNATTINYAAAYTMECARSCIVATKKKTRNWNSAIAGAATVVVVVLLQFFLSLLALFWVFLLKNSINRWNIAPKIVFFERPLPLLLTPFYFNANNFLE